MPTSSTHSSLWKVWKLLHLNRFSRPTGKKNIHSKGRNPPCLPQKHLQRCCRQTEPIAANQCWLWLGEALLREAQRQHGYHGNQTGVGSRTQKEGNDCKNLSFSPRRYQAQARPDNGGLFHLPCLRLFRETSPLPTPSNTQPSMPFQDLWTQQVMA